MYVYKPLFIVALLAWAPLAWAQTVSANPMQFGAVGNCVADDTAALVAMRDSLRGIQGSNLAISITIQFPIAKCFKYTNNRWTWGLRNLQVLGNFSSFLNVTSFFQGGAAAYPLITNRSVFETQAIDSPLSIAKPNQTSLIATVSAGSSSVMLLTPSEAASFTAGAMVMVYSYEQLLEGGYPPDARYVDYSQVVSTNTQTGQVIINPPLAHDHSATFPEAANAINGRARIFALDGFSPVPWGVSLYMENMVLLDNPNARRPTDGPGPNDPAFKSHQYLLAQGYQQIRLKNIVGGTLTLSSTPNIHVDGGHFFNTVVDKLVNSASYRNITIDNTVAECTGADVVSMAASKSGMVQCAPRRLLLRDMTFNTFGSTVYPPTINLNNAIPTTLVLAENSTFIGGGGTSIPVGGVPPADSLVVDGSAVAVSGNQVTMADITVPANRTFLRCTEPNGAFGLLKSGVGPEKTGMITGIDGGNSGTATLTLSIGSQIAVGDTLLCHPIKHGAIVLNGNTYQNYGGGPSLP